jgi:hypothetical protein
LFRLFHYLGRSEDAAGVIDRWENVSGIRDPAMLEALRTLERESNAGEIPAGDPGEEGR